MSSEGSITSNGSKIRQFGLYRSIDARTEEFLRLSRRRQIRQGCACAAVSTAITVTVVVVILLIYEYTIAVEWSLVQRIRSGNGTSNITHDTPFADKLDRTFFGFDQDYYERMPLLVNALQESNYVDPVIDVSRPLSKLSYNRSSTIPRTFSQVAYKQDNFRKSSPRPFIFEYRSATPLPFSKTYGSRSWVDSYRNAQRLQNIRQIIRYLEKTINAKTSDMHTKKPNSKTSIAFSGVYVEPKIEKDKSEESNSMELQQQNSNRVETYANHNEDPLFHFKPDSPGEVNLLAETFFRFSPVATPSHKPKIEPNKIPMFRRIPYNKNNCHNCDENVESKFNELKSSTEHNTELPTSTKSFSVMLNLYPLKPNASPEFHRYEERTKSPLDKIYITTTKPLIQFRKKPTPMRRTYYRYKKPRYLTRNRNTGESKPTIDRTTQNTGIDKNNTTMIVHVDIYSPEDKKRLKNHSLIHYTTSTIRPSSYLPGTEKPVELVAGQVQDYHDGSSGLITIQQTEQIKTTTLPSVGTILPFFDTTTASSDVNPWATRPTTPQDVFKFSAEDAKIPEHYINMATTQAEPLNTDRSSMHWETTQFPMDFNNVGQGFDTTQLELDRKYLNWETTVPTEIGVKNINKQTTQATSEMDRRSMNLVTTQSVPMEIIRINMDWVTTQDPKDMDESNLDQETTPTPNKMDRGNMKWATTQTPTEMDRYGQSIEKPINNLRGSLIIKLKNGITTTTEKTNPTTTEEEFEETTTSKTYVPQINGHYRNIIPRNHSRYSPEAYRKRKLEMSVTGFRSYVPMYTEIKRNKTNISEDNE